MSQEEKPPSTDPAPTKPVEVVLGRPDGLSDADIDAFAREFVAAIQSAAKDKPPKSNEQSA